MMVVQSERSLCVSECRFVEKGGDKSQCHFNPVTYSRINRPNLNSPRDENLKRKRGSFVFYFRCHASCQTRLGAGARPLNVTAALWLACCTMSDTAASVPGHDNTRDEMKDDERLAACFNCKRSKLKCVRTAGSATCTRCRQRRIDCAAPAYHVGRHKGKQAKSP